MRTCTPSRVYITSGVKFIHWADKAIWFSVQIHIRQWTEVTVEFYCFVCPPVCTVCDVQGARPLRTC